MNTFTTAPTEALRFHKEDLITIWDGTPKTSLWKQPLRWISEHWNRWPQQRLYMVLKLTYDPNSDTVGLEEYKRLPY